MTHRLLCCSDTHGQLPPVLDETGATAWLHGGDVADGPTLSGDDSSPFADPLREPIARWFASRPVPVLAVRGNHDTADEFHAFRSADDVTGRVVKVADGLFVAGVGWHGGWYGELPRESDLRPVCDAVERHVRRIVMPSDRLVLLTHYPPRLPGMREMERDVRDGGTWYDCVHELAEATSPVAVVQGHIHQWAGTSQTVELGGWAVTIFHPGRSGGTLCVDRARGGGVTIEWPVR
ncbi:MAG TPA: metallophosphoesterase [Humisphaera sp.]